MALATCAPRPVPASGLAPRRPRRLESMGRGCSKRSDSPSWPAWPTGSGSDSPFLRRDRTASASVCLQPGCGRRDPVRSHPAPHRLSTVRQGSVAAPTRGARRPSVRSPRRRPAPARESIAMVSITSTKSARRRGLSPPPRVSWQVPGMSDTGTRPRPCGGGLRPAGAPGTRGSGRRIRSIPSRSPRTPADHHETDPDRDEPETEHHRDPGAVSRRRPQLRDGAWHPSAGSP